MHARNVSIHLKANTAGEFTRTLEKDVLPVLRKQTGFKDEISFLTSDRSEAVAISLWDRKEDADNYNRDIYPQVLTSLAKVVEGTPKVQAYEVSNSTFHKSSDASLAELTEPQLLDLFHQSQPAWTSPEGGYGVR